MLEYTQHFALKPTLSKQVKAFYAKKDKLNLNFFGNIFQKTIQILFFVNLKKIKCLPLEKN